MPSPLFDEPQAVVTTTLVSDTQRKLAEATRGLSEAERQKIESLQKSLVPTDIGSISRYSQAADGTASKVVDDLLKLASSSSLDNIGGGINNILMAAKRIDAGKLGKASPGNWITRHIPWLFETKERLISHFKSVGDQIEAYTKTVRSDLDAVKTSIARCETMERECKAKFRSLEVSILAGAARCEELRAAVDAESERIKSLPQDQVDPMELQDLQKARQFVDTLERTVANQRQYQQVIFMQIPQFASLAATGVRTYEEFETIINSTIPLWKQQFALALETEQQKCFNKTITSAKDFTRDMMKANADNLRMATVDLAQQSARGFVEIETLDYVQDQLIQTITSVVAINAKARTDRAKVETSITGMREKFKLALSNT